jgi:hypothetical protein
MKAHYTQLMGSPIHFNDQARREYESRTRNLKKAIADA